MRRGLLLDLGPLRQSPQFRWLWSSTLIAGLGGQAALFAVVLQVFSISHSSLAVGAIGIFVAVPTIAFALFGGALADALDRRTLMLAVVPAQLLVAIGFVVQAALALEQLWLIYTLVAVQATIGAVAVPTRRTFLKRLFPQGSLAPVLALYVLAGQVAQIGGPLLGAALVASGGFAACYLAQALGLVLSLVAVIRLPAMPAEGPTSTVSPRAVGEALSFLVRSPVVRGAFLADVSLTVLGSPTALFPAINDERFGGEPGTLGLLTAALAAGGVVGIALSGPLGRIAFPGRALLIACAAWACAIVGVGASSSLWATLATLVACGMADVIALTLGQAIVQDATPDALRGRVSAAEQIVQMGGPQLGSLRAGIAGTALGPAVGLVSGGVLALVAVGALAASSPRLRRYSAGAPGPAAEPEADPEDA